MIISTTIMSRCKNCTDRCIGCHTTCGDYAIYKQELEKRGCVKVFKEFDSDKSVYSQYEANEKQLEWLGNHQVYYSKYACMR